MNSPFVLRELDGLAELEQAVQLQYAVWGADDQPESSSLMIAMQHEGALSAGAFVPDGTLAAYVFAFPTRDPQIQHSHRLAVHERYRRHGLGVRLKWFQHDWCATRGITLVRWTFDPLRAPNADLNMRRLGATAQTYFEDYYGVMGGINGQIPSDRFLAEWYVGSSFVVQRRASSQRDLPPIHTIPALNHVEDEVPTEIQLDSDAPTLAFYIPHDFGRIVHKQPDLAIAWRNHTRQILPHYFARGYCVTDFHREANAYVLEHTAHRSAPSTTMR